MVKFLQKILNKVTNEKTLEDTILESTKKEVETQTTLLQKKAGTYTGVPAPAISPSDSWFNDPVYSQKGLDYMQQETEIKIEDQKRIEERKNSGEVIESNNIHQLMYSMATKALGSWQENIGGSENFNSDSNEWSSGTGMGQYR
jgi:hypothetical protein